VEDHLVGLGAAPPVGRARVRKAGVCPDRSCAFAARVDARDGDADRPEPLDLDAVRERGAKGRVALVEQEGMGVMAGAGADLSGVGALVGGEVLVRQPVGEGPRGEKRGGFATCNGEAGAYDRRREEVRVGSL
jgi:hypothetical protein